MNKDYIIDANVIFSAIISGKTLYKNLILNYKFFSPDFCLIEIEKYENIIHQKAKISNEKLKEFTLLLFSHITIVPRYIISNSNIQKAYNLCNDIDSDDTLYIALSLELDMPFVTRDKKLKHELIKKDFHKILLFDELVDNILNKNI